MTQLVGLLVLVVVVAWPFRARLRRVARRWWRETVARPVRSATRDALDATPVIGGVRRARRQARHWVLRHRLTWVYRIPAAFPSRHPAPAKVRTPTGERGERLYVGIARFGRLWTRWGEHRGTVGGKQRKPWADRVIWLPLPALPGRKWYRHFPSVELFINRDHAGEVEMWEIANAVPAYNVDGARRETDGRIVRVRRGA